MATTSLSLDMLPLDVGHHVASFWGRQDFINMGCVSQKWQSFFEQETPWQSLFARTFGGFPPPVHCKKAFKERWGVELKSPESLILTATKFWMGANNQDPKRMQVHFNCDTQGSSPQFFYLQYDNFSAGNLDNVPTTCYFSYTGDVKQEKSPGILADYEWLKDVLDDDELDETREGKRVEYTITGGDRDRCRRITVVGADCINVLNRLNPYTLCFWAQIPIRDSKAWDLGYISSVDNWKGPIRLNRTRSDQNDRCLFKGFIPYGEVRFVKLYGRAQWTTEQAGPRLLKEPMDLNRSLLDLPIQFGEAVV
jgi:hypothetical protein